MIIFANLQSNLSDKISGKRFSKGHNLLRNSFTDRANFRGVKSFLEKITRHPTPMEASTKQICFSNDLDDYS